MEIKRGQNSVQCTFLQGEGNWRSVGRGGGGVGVGVDVGKASYYCRLGIIIVIYVTVPYLFRSPHLRRNGVLASCVT